MSTALVYNDTSIRERDEMLSLTDMWKANGGEEPKRPIHWQRTDVGREFIEFITANHQLKNSEVWIAKRGQHGGGTWAHWQIALAYAKFLSPQFHAWCNTVVRDHMEREREAREPLQAPEFTADVFTRTDARDLCLFILRASERQIAVQRQELNSVVQSAVRALANEVWGGANYLKRDLLSPEHLAKRGLELQPKPTAETTFKTVTEICWRLVGKGDAVHPKLPGIVTARIKLAAGEGRWQQGITDKRMMRDRQSPTFPVSEINRWLRSGTPTNAALIREENARLHRRDVLKQQGVFDFPSAKKSAK